MSNRPNITSAQIRAARALLNWSARELSTRSGVSQSSIHRAERAESRPSMHAHGLSAIKTALERHGVEFLDESGVQLASKQSADCPNTADTPSAKHGMETQSRCRQAFTPG
jgi:transcriptional regulator with XRE-family HTH domain